MMGIAREKLYGVELNWHYGIKLTSRYNTIQVRFNVWMLLQRRKYYSKRSLCRKI